MKSRCPARTVTWTLAALMIVFGAHTAAANGGSTLIVGLVNCINPLDPADSPTIQGAVDMAQPGSTIQVCPGVYPEDVVVPKTLTLKGGKAGVSGPSRDIFDTAGESIVLGSFTVQAPSVVIDGFTVTLGFPLSAVTIAITVKTAGDCAVITNNIIDQLGGGPDTTAPPLATNAIGVFLERGPDKVRVTRNQIVNLSSVPSAQGILIGDSVSANPSLNILISDNLIQNITSTTAGAYGILANNGARSTGYATVTVVKNVIQHLNGGGWAHAIGLEGPTPDAQVMTNDISDVNDLSPATVDEAAVFFEDNRYFPTAQTHLNLFRVTQMVAYGIAVNPGTTSGNVPGTCNWWNSPNGPATPSNPGGDGANVTPRVKFDPWLVAEAFHAPCPDNNNGCIGDDDDDFDHDGKRDDVDADDDNDGKLDANDDDDDNDGKWDNDDDDDDNDCIKDEDDDKSTRQHQRKGNGSCSGGGYNDSVIAGDDSGLPLIVRIESPNAQFLKIEIYDPAGRLLSVSLPTPGKIFAVAPANLLGLYTVRVRNTGIAPITYTSSIITSTLW